MIYELIFKDANDILFKKRERSVCFGGLAALSGAMLTEPRRKYCSAAKGTRVGNLETRLTADEFYGLRIVLKGADYKENTQTNQKWKRNMVRKAHDDIFSAWLGDMYYYEGPEDDPDAVMYTQNCPTFLMVAAASMWRINANNVTWFTAYPTLILRKESKEWHPLIKFLLAYSITRLSNPYTISFDEKERDKRFMLTSGNPGHAPFPVSLLNITDMTHLCLIDHEYIVDNLPSMYDNLAYKNCISYSGRDGWWRSPIVYGSTKQSESVHVIQSVASYYHKLADNLGIKNRHFYPNASASTSSNMRLYTQDELFLITNYIHEEVQKVVQSWT